MRLNLTLDELKQSAEGIVIRTDMSYEKKYKEVDVPSELMSPLYSCVGPC